MMRIIKNIEFTELVDQINRWNSQCNWGFREDGCWNDKACWTLKNRLLGLTRSNKSRIYFQWYWLNHGDSAKDKHDNQVGRELFDFMDEAQEDRLLIYFDPENELSHIDSLDMTRDEAASWFMGPPEDNQMKVNSRAKEKPGRPHFEEDIWAWKQINTEGKNPKDVYPEWLKKMEPTRSANYQNPERHFARLIKPEWFRTKSLK